MNKLLEQLFRSHREKRFGFFARLRYLSSGTLTPDYFIGAIK